ncbi:MAG: RNA polymerase sigma factor [Chlorobi bacterium]|nr:RNA polymerase sigma factor [Chlorobiota bacterium]
MDNRNKEKFWLLMKQAHKALDRYSKATAFRKEEAEDIFQETVMNAHENFESLRSEKAFLSFLFTIARRVQVDIRRKTSRIVLTEDDAADRLSSATTSPEEETDIAFLKENINKLPENYKEIIILAELTGLPLKDVAKIQNSTMTATKVRLFRARRKLASLMGLNDPISESDNNKINSEQSAVSYKEEKNHG